MARRKSKRKPRRRTQKKVNLIGVAEALVLANVTTEGLFNADLKHFLTGRVGTASYQPSNTDNVITLPELLGIDYTGLRNVGSSTNPKFTTQQMSFTSVGAFERIKENLRANGLDMGFKLVLIPVGFKAVTKLTRKPRSTANKMLNYTGIGVKV